MKNTSCKLDFDLKKIIIPDSAEEDLYIRSTIDYPAAPKVQDKAIFTFLKETIRPYSIAEGISEDFSEDDILSEDDLFLHGETKEFE